MIYCNNMVLNVHMYIGIWMYVCDLIHTVCICRMLKYVPAGKGISFSSVMEGIPFHIESWMQTGPTLQHCQDQVMHTLTEMYSVKYLHTHQHTYKPNVDIYTCNIHSYVRMYICDWACKNRPSECKNHRFLACLLYYTLITTYTTATKSLSLLQNLMGFLLQLMEME